MGTSVRLATAAFLTGLCCACCPTTSLAGIVVGDHSLDDWGISFSSSGNLLVPAGVSANPNFYSPYSSPGVNGSWGGNASLSPVASIGGFNFWYNYEDEPDSAGDSGGLVPHAGGQNYDGEFLGVGVVGPHLAVAIVTGQRPDNGLKRFAPGDLRIGTDGGLFGVELTGKTFHLDSQGYTDTGSPYLATAASQVAGSLWSSTTWLQPPFDPRTSTQLTGGNLVGNLNVGGPGDEQFYYSEIALADQHAFFELLIPLALFGEGTTITDVHWAPSCGNDLLDVNMNYTVMPEPASALILLQAGITFVLHQHRRRQRRQDDLSASR